MGAKSRTKGHNFEREIARRFRELFPSLTVRRSLQADRAHEPDLVIEAPREYPVLRAMWHELNDAMAPNPREKMAQAQRDIKRVLDPRYPVVVWHKTHEHTIWVTMTFEVFLALHHLLPESDADFLVTIDFDDYLKILAKHGPPTEAAPKVLEQARQ